MQAREEYYSSAAGLEQQARKELFKAGLTIAINDSDPSDSTSYEGYIMNNLGLFHLSPVVDKKTGAPTGDSKTVKLTPAEIMPIEILVSQDDLGKETEYVKLLYSAGSSYCTTTIRKSSLLNPMHHWEEMEDLREAGITDKEFKRGFGEHMRDLIKYGRQNGLIKEVKGRSRTGWFGNMHLRAGKPGYAGGAPIVSSIAGDAKIWRDTCTEMVSESPITGLTMAFCFSGYLRGKIGPAFSSMLHLHGLAGTGKTMASQAGASIEGSPISGLGSTMGDWRSSSVGMERKFAACTDGTAQLDEFHGFLTNNSFGHAAVHGLIYLLNGGGREKGSKSGEKLSMGGKWSINLVSTGNTSIVEQHCNPAGAVGAAVDDRTIEIDTQIHHVWPWIDSPRVSNYLSVLTANHGHGYLPTIEYIVANQNDLLLSYDSYHAKFSARSPVSKRKPQTLALIRVGIDIMAHVLELTPAVKQKSIDMLEVLITEIEDRSASALAEAEGDVLSDLRGFVNANLGHFTVDGHLWPMGSSNAKPSDIIQQSCAIDNSENVRRVGAWGFIKQPAAMTSAGEFTGRVAVMVPVANKCKDVNFESLVNKAFTMGFLVHDKGRKDSQSGTRGGYGRCYVFDLAKAMEISNPTVKKSAKVVSLKSGNKEDSTVVELNEDSTVVEFREDPDMTIDFETA